jgi:preprotein translocase subunit SecG
LKYPEKSSFFADRISDIKILQQNNNEHIFNFLVLITIVCFLLVVVIMVQNPKGGGLSSSLGGSTQIGGVKNFRLLDKSTWTLSAILIALILLSSLSFTGTLSDTDSKIIDNTELLRLHHQFKMLQANPAK